MLCWIVNRKVLLTASACTRLPTSILRWGSPVERRDDLLIGFLLLEHQELRLLRRHVALSDADRRFLRSQRLHVHRTLLLRGPALFNQRTIAVPCNLRQFGIGSRLLQSCLKLNQGALGLGNLMIELRGGDLGQKLPLLNLVADIDVSSI